MEKWRDKEPMEDLYFDIATKLHFGIDTVSLLGVTALTTGARAMIVYDPVHEASGILEKAVTSLSDAGVSPLLFNEASPFTTSRAAEKGIELAAKGQIQTVIGLGGTTVLSCARAIAGFTGTHEHLDPVFGKNEIEVKPVQFIGLPTSLRDPFLLTPRTLLVDARNRFSRIVTMKDFSAHTVIVDPVLSSQLSSVMVKSIGADLLVQNIEGFISTPSNFITQSLFLRSLDMIVELLGQPVDEPVSMETVTRVCQAGLLSSLGFSMGRLGLASAVAFAVKGLHQIPSSSVSALMLPHVLEYARTACLDKLLRIGPIINPEVRRMGASQAAETVIESFRILLGKLDLPMRLSLYGIEPRQLPLIARTAADIGVNGYLPVPLSTDEILSILKTTL
ncbi:MAG: iron-containing alcohol dehydrogenase [Spirochaetales bacterium]|nr:iron-containing alcohol dehydrogenase [Spirochaetales bacterium]